MVNGKAKFDINVKEFASFLPYKTSSSYAKILATVVEDFTGVQLNETGGVQLYPYRYEMSCVDYTSCYSFVADKEHEIIFKITLVDGTLLKDTKTPVKVSYQWIGNDWLNKILTFQSNRSSLGKVHRGHSPLQIWR